MTFNQQQWIQFNGEPVVIDSQQTVAGLIEQQNMAGNRFVVVINDEIVPKSRWADRQISDGDQIDIMSPISGG